MNIKENLANNLIAYRKKFNMTQAELAQKLNYSDKAVSKWERGESVPDLEVLKQIADFYGVSIDILISEHKKTLPNSIKNLPKKRVLICLCISGLVWCIATFAFSFINIIFPSIVNTWLSFIYAVPITLVVLLVLTSVWGKSTTNLIITSLFLWTLTLSVYLTLICALQCPPINLWEIFIIVIPLQALILFWFFYRKNK